MLHKIQTEHNVSASKPSPFPLIPFKKVSSPRKYKSMKAERLRKRIALPKDLEHRRCERCTEPVRFEGSPTRLWRGGVSAPQGRGQVFFWEKDRAKGRKCSQAQLP